MYIKGNTDKTKCINNTIHAVNNIMFNVVRESSHLACHIGDFKKKSLNCIKFIFWKFDNTRDQPIGF